VINQNLGLKKKVLEYDQLKEMKNFETNKSESDTEENEKARKKGV